MADENLLDKQELNIPESLDNLLLYGVNTEGLGNEDGKFPASLLAQIGGSQNGNIPIINSGDLPSVAFTENDDVQPLYDALNARPLKLVPHGSLYMFSTVRVTATSSNTAIADKRFYFFRSRISNISGAIVDASGSYYGVGSGITLDASNMGIWRAERYQLELTNGEVTGTTINDIGDLGGNTISSVVNSLPEVITPVNEFILIEATENNESNFYIYNGAEPIIGGGSKVIDSDFRMISDTDSDVLVAAPAIRPLTSSDSVSILDFGAKGDGVQLKGFSVTGNILTHSDPIFKPTDVGKTVSIANAGTYNEIDDEHLVSTIVSFTNVNAVVLADTATTDVVDQLGSYGTDNIEFLQRAFDFAIQNNVKLKAPAGVFLIGDLNVADNFRQVRMLFDTPYQNFHLEGAGKGLTVFRELDGKTQRIGRFTTMFYCNQPSTDAIGHIYMGGFTMDKNGRSLTKSPDTFFTWEQAHAITMVKSDLVNQNTIETIHYENIEIYDKIGGGITYSSSDCLVGKYLAEDISERGFKGIGGDAHPNGVVYGQRADVEVHAISTNIVITNSKMRYCQFEPVSAGSSGVDKQRKTFFSNCTIGILEPTELSSFESLQYNELFVSNCVLGSFVGRGLRWKINNSKIGVNQNIHSVNGVFINCEILVPWDSEANTITTLTFVNYGDIKNRIKFNNCDILIDSEEAVNPTGFATTSTSNLEVVDDNIVEFFDCNFDKRFDQIGDCVNNGTWIFKGCNLSGLLRVFSMGASGVFACRVILENNNYDNFLGTGTSVLISNNSTAWELQARERVPHEKWHFATSGSTGNADTQITVFPTLLIDDITNRAGTHRRGEIFEVLFPDAGEFSKYRVTTTGSGAGSVVKGYGQLEI